MSSRRVIRDLFDSCFLVLCISGFSASDEIEDAVRTRLRLLERWSARELSVLRARIFRVDERSRVEATLHLSGGGSLKFSDEGRDIDELIEQMFRSFARRLGAREPSAEVVWQRLSGRSNGRTVLAS